ncbi:Nif3-like dinuclear metal center hexameric protein [Entomoplasma ellychniae]|uniref:GTP cyclohydrolase 1 type 2 homolog n=1 Tax=Entomoplasma ellychniae TaxID=2114 RepID=A0A8E2QWP3_9MOLU|nr:Nif3-like dinuclear metal center hexameric protein [Entomoplasma ellychniae]PPE05062.1 Nif3-like dinuclear metal center hexameric protein [Entomoplasma ellychniae]
MQLIKLAKYLEKKFPSNKAGEWDKVGFQLFDKKMINFEQEISNIFITLDLTSGSFEEIKKTKPNFIITRHPFIFKELDKEKKNPFKKEVIKYLKNNNVLVFSIHTNYDYCAYQTFIEIACSDFEVKKIEKPNSQKDFLEIKFKKSINQNELIKKLKKTFETDDIQISKNIVMQELIDNIYINQGSGASSISNNSLSDCTFVTGEAKWSDWIYANDNNVKLITVGHYMENYFIQDLNKKLSDNFKDLKIKSYDITNQYKKYKEN